jgi:hypothetical protein
VLVSERFLFLCCSLVLFSSGSYSYPYMSSLSQHYLINAIRWKRNFERAQSKPAHAKDIRSRLDTGQRPRSRVGLMFPQDMFSFLFPSNFI